MSYKLGQNKKHTRIPVIVAISILSLILLGIGLFLWYHETVIQREVNILSFEELKSGRHLVGKFPFIINVGDDEIAVAYEERWNYIVSYFKQTNIPKDYVGILTRRDDKNVEMGRVLLPGNHKINLAVYNISLIDLSPQTHTFTNN